MSASTFRIAGLAIAFALFGASGSSAQMKPAAGTIVDVPVGSPLVDYSGHSPGRVRAVQRMTSHGETRTLPDAIWTFTYSDTGGKSLLHVTSLGGSFGTTHAVFDRRTLALRQIRNGVPTGPHITLDADGNRLRGEMAGPMGTRPIDVTLAAPAFFGGLHDIVIESLPRAEGVGYRLPIWRPGTDSVDMRVYTMVRREDVEVLGTVHPRAAVVEERDARDGTLRGTLWLVDHAPFLVRWIIDTPDGSIVRLDQQPFGQ